MVGHNKSFFFVTLGKVVISQLLNIHKAYVLSNKVTNGRIENVVIEIDLTKTMKHEALKGYTLCISLVSIVLNSAASS